MIYILLILTLILSACTTHETTIGEDAPHDPEQSRYMIYNLLGPFEIDSEKSPLTAPLVEIQERCEGEDFVRYRECFLKRMREIQGSFMQNSQEQKFLETFGESLQKEIEYYSYYQELDAMDYPVDELFSLEGKDCYVVGTGGLRTEYMGVISESTIPIILSYNTTDKYALVGAFPSWGIATMYDVMSFSGSGHDPQYPCMYRTFGPSYGNIIYTKTLGDNLYVFIKVNEGVGSGEFYYSVYVHNLISRTHKNIGGFWAWSGIVPFGYNLNMEKQKTSVTEAYKNQPFLYYQLFENKRIHGDTVESVYLRSIQ